MARTRNYAAGEVAQCDFWFPPATVPVGAGQERSSPRLPVLTMVSGYSRWLSAVLVPSRHAADLFAGWWQLIEGLGAVPRALAWDGEGAVGRHRGGQTELTDELGAAPRLTEAWTPGLPALATCAAMLIFQPVATRSLGPGLGSTRLLLGQAVRDAICHLDEEISHELAGVGEAEAGVAGCR
jgi:hypothetical protein